MRRGLLFYVVCVATVAVALVVFLWASYPIDLKGTRPWSGVLVLAALIAIGEGLTVRMASGKAFSSVALIPTVAAVPLFGPSVAVLSRAVAQIVTHAVVLRHERIKWVFNVAQGVIAIGLGSVVYKNLGGPVNNEEFVLLAEWRPLAAFAALIATYFVTNLALVGTVIALDTGKRVTDIWRQLGPVAFANDLASSSFALLVVFAFAQMGALGVFLVVLVLLVVLPLYFVHHAYRVQSKLEQQNREILELLVRTIEAKDPYTSGHSLRVAAVSRKLAEALGVSADAAEEVETAALLHDIGKIDFAYSELIGSPAQLSDADREIIRSHPERGARLLASVSSLSRNVIAAVRHHHEHYDGNGYPAGLAGNDIPLPARIIMISDTVDAMLSNRPYRAALTAEQVARELKRFSGRQFDPMIVAKFLALGLVQRAARRAEMERTPLPLAKTAHRERASVS